MICKVLQVSRSYYYARVAQRASGKGRPWILETRLKQLFNAHRGNYGSRRLMRALQKEGGSIGRYRTCRLMRKLGLKVHSRPRFRCTTESRHAYPMAPNRLDRNFNPTAPNQAWTADITYIPVGTGWVYLAVVMDLYGRQVVGWSVQDHMRTGLCTEALTMAYWRRKPLAGLIHHSDRGSQYASFEYQDQLKAYQIRPSMSRKGNCWDNSPTERLFRTLKSEWLQRFHFRSLAEVKAAVWDYVSYYNSVRSHSALGYCSPMEYERAYWKNKAA